MSRSGMARSGLVTIFLSLVPSVAFAHTGIGSTVGFFHGFEHPVSGLDHVLAMVAVGVLASQLGGRALWAVPAAFVAVMALAGAQAMTIGELPFVETGIALSVLVLGAVLALGVKLPVAAAMALVGFFAIFHGQAHGLEMPENAGGFAYGAGFMMATALLHIIGIGMGFAIAGVTERRSPLVVRAVGGLVALAGIGILTGLV